MELTKNSNKIAKDILVRANIQGDWSIVDFRDYLQLFDKLQRHDLFMSYSLERKRINPLEEYLIYEGMLYNSGRVKSISYASPGWIELIISAATITSIVALIKHYIPNRKEWSEIRKIQSETFEKNIDSLKKIGYSNEEIKQLFMPELEKTLFKAERTLTHLYTEKKIESLEYKEFEE